MKFLRYVLHLICVVAAAGDITWGIDAFQKGNYFFFGLSVMLACYMMFIVAADTFAERWKNAD